MKKETKEKNYKLYSSDYWFDIKWLVNWWDSMVDISLRKRND